MCTDGPQGGTDGKVASTRLLGCRRTKLIDGHESCVWGGVEWLADDSYSVSKILMALEPLTRLKISWQGFVGGGNL